jgi:hypothetical protein
MCTIIKESNATAVKMALVSSEEILLKTLKYVSRI